MLPQSGMPATTDQDDEQRLTMASINKMIRPNGPLLSQLS
jgi:hypothetical protein